MQLYVHSDFTSAIEIPKDLKLIDEKILLENSREDLHMQLPNHQGIEWLWYVSFLTFAKEKNDLIGKEGGSNLKRKQEEINTIDWRRNKGVGKEDFS